MKIPKKVPLTVQKAAPFYIGSISAIVLAILASASAFLQGCNPRNYSQRKLYQYEDFFAIRPISLNKSNSSIFRMDQFYNAAVRSMYSQNEIDKTVLNSFAIDVFNHDDRLRFHYNIKPLGPSTLREIEHLDVRIPVSLAASVNTTALYTIDFIDPAGNPTKKSFRQSYDQLQITFIAKPDSAEVFLFPIPDPSKAKVLDSLVQIDDYLNNHKSSLWTDGTKTETSPTAYYVVFRDVDRKKIITRCEVLRNQQNSCIRPRKY